MKIRIPDRLRLPDDGKSLVIDQVTFDYDRAVLEAALNAGTALSWRLHRNERGWRAFVSFDHKPAPKTTLDVMYGAVGVDLNIDHLAATETDAFGNRAAHGTIVSVARGSQLRAAQRGAVGRTDQSHRLGKRHAQTRRRRSPRLHGEEEGDGATQPEGRTYALRACFMQNAGNRSKRSASGRVSS
ncbi:hypothetical protein [Paraburkholderia hospita]|uniref:hypothetical protein n=1 Tax=Paraburkholderia hospita TaxID=169430 RepID=UPI001F614FF9|nr:hypothetical protein [Paraburkholderia hospita]